ncbi:catalase [Agaricus bisporus var. bisporus H97]|uniref:catalase n=1 Tax=Agaricus bisporus var. bisporus (strain H97 / ATCC MYA-4626 / FGSC 10389) TaxID=936046 RepID=UPI00029F7885|nr:catalase [Agaricus bisporus var. bisporus H97]EKV50511.1 catalase [Agaricus bisporus var. bisporus H97]
MAAFAQAATKAVSKVTYDAKTSDLKNVTVDCSGDTGLTTDHGVKIPDTDNWLKISDGEHSGPLLLEDQISREKLHRFDHERIPERVVHARGFGAHGHFKVYDDSASKFTFAPVLTDSTRNTPILIRFSPAQGSRGSPDTVRDVRGFAMKFYTPEGIWDLVGNDIPVFFIQDAVKFPDFVHALKPEPHNEVPQGQTAHNNFWDFVGLMPESAHMVCWVMSDRGIPRSYRMMQGFGVNTFTLINDQGEQSFVKFHMIPELGVHSLVWDEALKINGEDPDFHRKDLNEAIENGCPPKWTFGIQVIEEKDEHNFDFDILDATKVWPEELVPVQIIGEFVLDRTVDEVFPELEQVAFCTSHVVPGIGFSDDPLLQGRNFSYFDTQINRLGINWEQLPINRPTCPIFNHNRDGAMNSRINANELNYYPNRENRGHPIAPNRTSGGGYVDFQEKVQGIKQRVRGAKFQEHFNQAQLFYNSLKPHEKGHLIRAFSFELDHCDDERVYKTYTELLRNIDLDLAKTVAENVGGIAPDSPARPNHGKIAPSLSQDYFMPPAPTIATRRVAILIADGFNYIEVQTMRGLLAMAKATCWIIGPRRGEVKSESQISGVEGMTINADHHYEGQRSTLFDAIFVPSGPKHAEALMQNGRAIHWIREAFGHCKAISAIGEGVAFLKHAIQLPEVDLELNLDVGKVTTSYGVVTTGKYSVISAAAETFTFGPNDEGFESSFAYEISKHRCWDRELDGLTERVAF